MIERLVWLHVFDKYNICTPEQLLNILMTEKIVPHNQAAGTIAGQDCLNILPSVYAYLAMPDPMFGHCAVAISQSDFHGNISPFDTGGLEKMRTRLGDDISREDLRTYFEGHQFESRDLHSKLEIYPSAALNKLKDYLTGTPPDCEGPHVLFGTQSVKHLSIWTERGDLAWKAWTWEGRVRDKLQLGSLIRHWTCRDELHSPIMELIEAGIENAENETQETLYVHLLQTYVKGGIQHLHSILLKTWLTQEREGQVEAGPW